MELSELNKIFQNYQGKEEEVIPILQDVQEKHGYLSSEYMEEVAKFISVPKSRIFGIATFYAQFRFKPRGEKHIMVCRGTACHVKGANPILDEIKNILEIEEGETTKNKKYSLETVACIGACSLAPCIMINNEVKANLTAAKIRIILK